MIILFPHTSICPSPQHPKSSLTDFPALSSVSWQETQLVSLWLLERFSFFSPLQSIFRIFIHPQSFHCTKFMGERGLMRVVSILRNFSFSFPLAAIFQRLWHEYEPFFVWLLLIFYNLCLLLFFSLNFENGLYVNKPHSTFSPLEFICVVFVYLASFLFTKCCNSWFCIFTHSYGHRLPKSLHF